MVRAAEGRGVSLFAAGYWADTVLAQTKPDIDPAAGTGDHEAEPGRNDEYASPQIIDLGEALKRSMGTKAEPGRMGE
jgi:hypothetical protein